MDGSGSFTSILCWFCLCISVLNTFWWLKSRRWSARSTRFRATGVAVCLGRKLLVRLIDVERGCLGRRESVGINSWPAWTRTKPVKSKSVNIYLNHYTILNQIPLKQSKSNHANCCRMCRLVAFRNPSFWAAPQRTKWHSTSKPITFLYWLYSSLLRLTSGLEVSWPRASGDLLLDKKWMEPCSTTAAQWLNAIKNDTTRQVEQT